MQQCECLIFTASNGEHKFIVLICNPFKDSVSSGQNLMEELGGGKTILRRLKAHKRKHAAFKLITVCSDWRQIQDPFGKAFFNGGYLSVRSFVLPLEERKYYNTIPINPNKEPSKVTGSPDATPIPRCWNGNSLQGIKSSVTVAIHPTVANSQKLNEYNHKCVSIFGHSWF